jgi:hypothetical protein
MRLPRLLAACRPGASADGSAATSELRSDVVMLTEGTRLLGDVASVRALGRLLHLIDEPAESGANADLADAVGTVALLLGRWAGPAS